VKKGNFDFCLKKSVLGRLDKNGQKRVIFSPKS